MFPLNRQGQGAWRAAESESGGPHSAALALAETLRRKKIQRLVIRTTRPLYHLNKVKNQC